MHYPRGLLPSLGYLLLIASACEPEEPPSPTEPTFEERLREASTDAVVVERDDDGRVQVVTGAIPVPDSVPTDPVSRADWFLDEYGDEVGVEDVEGDVEVSRVDEGDAGTAEEGDALVTYERTVDDVPVEGAEVKVEVEAGGAVTVLISRAPTDVTPPSTTPTVTAEDAEATALATYRGETTAPPELVIVNPSVFGRPIDAAYLAWKMRIFSFDPEPSGVVVYVDALTGALVPYQYSSLHSARNRMIYDAGNRTNQTTIQGGARTLIYDEDGTVAGATPTSDATAVWNGLGTTWSFYWNSFGMDSYDKLGATVVAHVHYHTAANNGYWSPDTQSMWLMDGKSSLDWCAHEYTHAVTEHSAGLVYEGESGALNESMSDVFAAFIDQGGDPWRWNTERDMQNPQAIAAPWSGTTYPRHYSQIVPFTYPTPAVETCTVDSDCGPTSCYDVSGRCTSVPCTEWTCENGGCAPEAIGCNDYMGVHFNSSLPNHVAYLVTEGGTHADSGVEVTGVGFDKAAQIWFRALTWYMTDSADFTYAKIATRLAAWKFARKEMHGVTYEDCGSVIDGWGAAGVGTPDEDDDCHSDAVDNCPTIYNPMQDSTACNCTSLSTCETCAEREDCAWCWADVNGSCHRLEESGSPPCEMPVTDAMMCMPPCRDLGEPCSGSGTSFDEECCDALICVVGACREPIGAREREACDPTMVDACASGLSCRRVGSMDASPTCCAQDGEYCEAKADCCGLMDCTGNRCVGRTSGEECMNGDCVGASFCDAGTCT